MHQWIAIFFVTIWILISRQDIAILWYCVFSWIKNSTFRNDCLHVLRDLAQVQALSKLMLFIKQRDLGKGKEVPSLLCTSGHVSFKMAAQRHMQFQLLVSWHSLVCPRTKRMVTALLHLSVVCNDILYCVSYHGTCIEICIVWWEIVSL